MNIEVTHALWRTVHMGTPWAAPKPKPPKALHIPRPGEKKPGPRVVTPLELISTLRG